MRRRKRAHHGHGPHGMLSADADMHRARLESLTASSRSLTRQLDAATDPAEVERLTAGYADVERERHAAQYALQWIPSDLRGDR